MIDIHSHILFGVDDGPETLEESLAMVRMAAACGTTDMVATAHANLKYEFDAQAVERKVAQLQEAVGPSPRIHYGCELHLTLENVEDAVRSPGKYSIGHRGYVLVEFSDFLVPKTTPQVFARMMEAGLRPIVAHPERNPIMQKRLSELEGWVRQGALLQVTAQSFFGRFGRSAKASAHDLMGRGLVHFLASDAHHAEHRPPGLDEAREYVARNFGAPAARRVLEENPRAVLAGEPLPPVPIAIKRRKRFLLW
ncbi:MAG: exopolysaccharide biosynthesis protein [Acidobacteriia bacterium]|nr:exopolysaccharide biosynthesis protein [Terriglobia bacterium]